MNDSSPIKKAILDRGKGISLSPDFMGATMHKVVKADRRRKRNILIWSIVGYTIVAAVVIATLIIVCGVPLSRGAASVIAEAKATSSYLPSVVSLMPVGAILLVMDYYLRRKLLKE